LPLISDKYFPANYQRQYRVSVIPRKDLPSLDVSCPAVEINARGSARNGERHFKRGIKRQLNVIKRDDASDFGARIVREIDRGSYLLGFRVVIDARLPWLEHEELGDKILSLGRHVLEQLFREVDLTQYDVLESLLVGLTAERRETR
jgi:hypothetical protein